MTNLIDAVNLDVSPAGLVKSDRVHTSLYTDAKLFDAELEKIFYSTWVWVAHASEIPDSGSYKSTFIGKQPVIVVCLLFAFPFFWLIDTHVSGYVYLALLVGLAFCHGAMIGTQPALMGELFPAHVRYSGMALGHEIASIFSGGLAPLAATALYGAFHSAWPVSVMLIVFGLITTGTLFSIRRKPDLPR